MLKMGEVVGVGNGQRFFAIVADELLTVATVFNRLTCTGTQKQAKKQEKGDSGDHEDQPCCSNFRKSMMAAFARAM